MRRVILLLAVLLPFLTPPAAEAHYQPGRHNVRHAINLSWCGRSNSYCPAGQEAWNVAGCETGYTYSVWAANGQFLGLFQMGAFARARYGHGWNPWAQARAAHGYYLDAGWSPWQCLPGGGLRW